MMLCVFLRFCVVEYSGRKRDMIRKRQLWYALMLVVLVAVMTFGVRPRLQVQAARKGLVKKGSVYSFYQNGKKIKNKWKTVKEDGRKYRFYFGKNGNAYRAGKLYRNAYNVKLFRIGKKQYGFDSNSHLAPSGTFLDGSFRFVAIGRNGIYLEPKTKKLRSGMKTYQETGKVSAQTYDKVVSLLGKPSSVKRSSSCSPWNEQDSFTDVLMVYPHFEVQLIQNDRTGEYALDGYFPR